MDQQQRELFCHCIDRNFSVIAPAGVGKTYAITERIYNIADKAPEMLRGLYVITYTKKAAETLRTRVKNRLQKHPNFSQFEYLFSQSFFGTIHSLCWQHIQQFDPQIHYEVLQEDTSLKNKFLSTRVINDPIYKYFAHVLRFVDLDILCDHFELPVTSFEIPKEPFHRVSLDLSPIYGYNPEPRNKTAIGHIKSSLEQWEKDYATDMPLPLPECLVGGENFKQVYYKTFEPLFKQLEIEALLLAKILSKHYYEFRVQQGFLKHTDLIYLAQCNLSKPNVKQFFEQTPISILLDEAQDTDPYQFQYLQTLVNLNKHNRFSMVGDPQQAIYSSRADVNYYLDVHKTLVEHKICTELIFSKTFRCPEAIVSMLNRKFPTLLCPEIDKKQVRFVPLISAAQTVGTFQIIPIQKPTSSVDVKSYEIEQLSNILKAHLKTYPTELSNICILAPRKDWLNEISFFLNQHGWLTQLYSSNITGRTNSFFCNVLTFIHLINFPNDSFELVGMLERTFCIPTHALTDYENEFQIACATLLKDDISNILQMLFQLRQEVMQMSLWDGIIKIIEFFKDKCPPNPTDSDAFDILLNTTSRTQNLHGSWIFLEQHLRPYLTSAINSEPQLNIHSIQCYTCHKAKGLEWDTVILPFFYRPIRHAPPRYPLLYNNHILWHKYEHILNQDRILSQKRELQRLFYVACTRAKKHLIFIDDANLWKKETGTFSWGDL